MYLVHLLIWTSVPLISVSPFEVTRHAADPKDGNEPYMPVNYFVNKDRKRGICLFMFCWRHHGNCKSIVDCCECKCRNSSTFFSDPLGCREGHDMTILTKDAGKACFFTTKKFGFDYVPLFDNSSSFVDIELDLPRHNSLQNDGMTFCKAGVMHEYDYHGRKLLFNRNLCNEHFQVNKKQSRHYLQFHSNESMWNSFRGRLLSIDIKCYSGPVSNIFSSCFLFQVEGIYKDKLHREEPSEVTAGHTCPTVYGNKRDHSPARETETSLLGANTSLKILSTQSGKETSIISTMLQLSSASPSFVPRKTSAHTTPRTQPVSMHSTMLPSTPFIPPWKHINFLNITKRGNEAAESLTVPTKVTVIFVESKNTGTTISVLTGLGTGLAVVMICIIIWLLIKRRKNMLQSHFNTSIFSPEVNPYDDDFHYDVPKIDRVKQVHVVPECGVPIGHGCNSDSVDNYCPVDYDPTPSKYIRQYSYIEVGSMLEQDFEGTENTASIKSRKGSNRSSVMSKRPLPEKPMDSGNPYYGVTLRSEKSDKSSGINDMYSLYSTIDDVNESQCSLE